MVRVVAHPRRVCDWCKLPQPRYGFVHAPNCWAVLREEKEDEDK